MIYLLINPKILSYNGYYKIINSANIKKLSQYRYWLKFFLILAEFMILFCKDSLECIDNNNIELINKLIYFTTSWAFCLFNFKMSSNWNMSVTELHHRLAIKKKKFKNKQNYMYMHEVVSGFFCHMHFHYFHHF